MTTRYEKSASTTRVKVLVDKIETKDATKKIPMHLALPTLDTLGFAPNEVDTTGACLTARVARLMNHDREKAPQICVDCPSSKNDFIDFAASQGISPAVAGSEIGVPTIVDYKKSSRAAQLWVQVETGHVVFAFSKKALGCVHILEIMSITKSFAGENELQESGSAALKKKDGKKRFGIIHSLSAVKEQTSEPKTLSSSYPWKATIQIKSKSYPLIVGFMDDKTRRNELERLAALKDFFQQGKAARPEE